MARLQINVRPTDKGAELIQELALRHDATNATVVRAILGAAFRNESVMNKVNVNLKALKETKEG